jgi:hypothetical protein
MTNTNDQLCEKNKKVIQDFLVFIREYYKINHSEIYLGDNEFVIVPNNRQKNEK